MNPRDCPVCGHELVFKHGMYGQFIGCSNYPACTFTMNEDGTSTKRKREVDEWNEHGNPSSYGYTPVIRAKTVKRCRYNTCDGSGLLPFTLPDGTISKHAKVFCECHDEYANPNPLPLRPLDFDYGMSYSVYRSLCREHGWQDPGSDYPDEPVKPKEQVIVHRYSDMRKQDWDLLQQTALKAQFLENKIAEMTKRRKPETKYGYKGIR